MLNSTSRAISQVFLFSSFRGGASRSIHSFTSKRIGLNSNRLAQTTFRTTSLKAPRRFRLPPPFLFFHQKSSRRRSRRNESNRPFNSRELFHFSFCSPLARSHWVHRLHGHWLRRHHHPLGQIQNNTRKIQVQTQLDALSQINRVVDVGSDGPQTRCSPHHQAPPPLFLAPNGRNLLD